MEIEFFADPGRCKTLLPPVPASQAMPTWWYKAQGTFMDETEEYWREVGKPADGTFKRCQPFTDALRTGYIIPLWRDIGFADRSTDPSIKNIQLDWGRGEYREAENKPWESWAGIEGIENLIPDSSFSLMSPWIIRTPPGYSCYFTAPINGENPHIRLFSGIVNTDTYFNHVNFFFGFREHGPTHGILKQGMPLVQIIPFKREEWTASITPLMPNTEEAYNQQNVKNGIDSVYIGGYKNHHGCPVNFA